MPEVNYLNSQASDKLAAKCFHPFTVIQLIGEDARRLDLLNHMKTHQVMHVPHKVPNAEQPEDNELAVAERPISVPSIEGEEQVVDNILGHQSKRRGYQFLKLRNADPHHEAVFQLTKRFLDNNGIVTEVWEQYMQEQGILPEYY